MLVFLIASNDFAILTEISSNFNFGKYPKYCAVPASIIDNPLLPKQITQKDGMQTLQPLVRLLLKRTF